MYINPQGEMNECYCFTRNLHSTDAYGKRDLCIRTAGCEYGWIDASVWREQYNTGSAIDVSVRPDVSMGPGGLMHQYGGNNTITGSAIHASLVGTI